MTPGLGGAVPPSRAELDGLDVLLKPLRSALRTTSWNSACGLRQYCCGAVTVTVFDW